MSSTTDRSQRKFGPIWLSPGITKFNTTTLFFVGMMTLVFVTTQGLLHPYLLHEHLKMPTEIQGKFTGNLVVITEIVAIFVIIFAGVLSDRVGRRPIYIAAFLLMGFSLVLIPFARTPVILIVFRVIATVALTSALMMLAAIIADYPQNRSRGSLIGINGVITGVGIVLIGALTFAQLPDYFVGRGVAPIMAGTYTYLIVAAAAVLSALGAWIGLKRGRPAEARERPPLSQLMRTGAAAVRENPRLGLTCAAYFVSRGDLLVFALFFSLWLVAAGTDQGMTPADASSATGRLFGISQVSMLLFTPVMGFIADRIDRVTALAIAMAIGTIGYLALGTVGDPFSSPHIIPAAILAGAGEACIIVACPALLGQEAPAKIRGSVIGLVGMCGAVGVLIHAKIAGWLFDMWIYQAPFVYMAGFNLLTCVAAIWVRVHYGKSSTSAATAADAG